jgi:uncharacterized membrane protein YeiH
MVSPVPIELEAPLLAVLNYAGLAVFAATGALAAARTRQDVVTALFFAAMTGVGGGTLRDLLMGVPIFWMEQPNYIAVCLGSGLFVWLIGPPEQRLGALLWLDAIGLGAFAVLGAAKALHHGEAELVAVVMGVITVAAGGIVRDLLAGEPSILLRREIYITAAVLGATVAVFGRPWLGETAYPAGFVAAFGLRALALKFEWSMPGFSGGLWRAVERRREGSRDSENLD